MKSISFKEWVALREMGQPTPAAGAVPQAADPSGPAAAAMMKKTLPDVLKQNPDMPLPTVAKNAAVAAAVATPNPNAAMTALSGPGGAPTMNRMKK